MALERFIAEHVVISATLRGVNAERMTALEIHLGCMRFEVALATHIVEAAETEDNFNGAYTDLIAILEAIGEKFGVDYNDGINGAEAVEYMDDGEIFERANELMAV
jgi:hypothetical protein